MGFEIAGDIPPYCGIRGYGQASLEIDTDHNLIKRLYGKYFSNKNSQLYRFLTDSERDEIRIIITPEQIFDWNFDERMQDSDFIQKERICP